MKWCVIVIFQLSYLDEKCTGNFYSWVSSLETEKGGEIISIIHKLTFRSNPHFLRENIHYTELF